MAHGVRSNTILDPEVAAAAFNLLKRLRSNGQGKYPRRWLATRLPEAEPIQKKRIYGSRSSLISSKACATGNCGAQPAIQDIADPDSVRRFLKVSRGISPKGKMDLLFYALGTYHIQGQPLMEMLECLSSHKGFCRLPFRLGFCIFLRSWSSCLWRMRVRPMSCVFRVYRLIQALL